MAKRWGGFTVAAVTVILIRNERSADDEPNGTFI